MKKNLIKKIIGVFFLDLFLCGSIKAIPYSERHAFCTEKSGIAYGGYYESQKRYNKCMSNAEYLIREHERKQAEYKIRQKKEEHERNKRFDSIFGSPW